jgi:hypothetical protein
MRKRNTDQERRYGIMNEKKEKRKRYNQKLEFIARFNKWLESEPPMILFWRWRKWKKSRPIDCSEYRKIALD